MGAALHAAFKWLVEHLRLEIDLSESVLNAAAPPPGKRPGSRTAAGTLTIAAHCQLEYVASAAGVYTLADPLVPTPVVLIARSLLAYGWDQSVRVQDMARTAATSSSDLLD